jgi:hypothetical protein
MKSDSSRVTPAAAETPQVDARLKFWRWSRIIDESPGSWIVLGLFLFLLASGSVTFGHSGYSIKLGKPPSELLCACISSVGMSLIVLGVFAIANKRTPFNQTSMWLLTALWGLCVSAIFVNAWLSERPLPKTRYWGYDFASHRFEIFLPAEALRRYAGQRYLLVVRKANSERSFETDPNVIISAPFSIDSFESEFHGSVDLTKISGDLRLGDDQLECHVVIVPRDFDRRNALTFEQLLLSGGQDYTACGNDVTINKVTAANALALVQLLSPAEQSELVNHLKEITKVPKPLLGSD